MLFSCGSFNAIYLRFYISSGIASYLTAFYFHKPNSLDSLLFVVYFILFSAVLTALQLFSDLLPSLSWVEHSQTLLGWGKSGDPILYGMFLIFGTIFFVVLYCNGRKKYVLLLLQIMMVAIVVNASRAVWIGTLAGVLTLAFLRGETKLCVLLLMMFGLAFSGVRAIGAVIPSLVASSSSKPRSELMYKTNPKYFMRELSQEASKRGRYGILLTGLRMWRQYPLLGVGPGNFEKKSTEFAVPEQLSKQVRDEDYFDPQNIYLAILSESGTLGFVGFLGMLSLVILRFFKQFTHSKGKHRLRLAGIFSFFMGLSVVGLAHDVHLDRLYWIALGFLNGAGAYHD